MFVRKDKLHAVHEEDCKTDMVSSGVQLNEDSNMSQGSSNHGLCPVWCSVTVSSSIIYKSIIFIRQQFS